MIAKEVPAGGPATVVALPGRRRAGTLSLAAAGVLALALVVLAIDTDRFLTLDNLRAILSSASIVGIAALGATAVMLVGGQVSLATAALASVTAMVFLALLGAGVVPAVLATLAVGGLAYGVLGLLVGAFAVNPIVLTVGASSLLTGLTVAITGGDQVTPAGGGFSALNGRVLTLPVSVWTFFVLAVVLHLVLTRTTVGRRIFLVGESRATAIAAGLPVRTTVVAAFAIGGALTAVAGMFLGAVNTNASLEVGGNLTFDAIAAVLVGGTAIAGGSGSALRTLGGALVVAAISDLLVLRGYATGTQTCIQGVLVLLVVLGVHLRRTGAGR
jgi:simple sugar transport system permease protein/ribose transport system permease protein